MPGCTNFVSDFLCRALREGEEESQDIVETPLQTAIAHVIIAKEIEFGDVERNMFAEIIRSTSHHKEDDGSIVVEQPLSQEQYDYLFALAHTEPNSGHFSKERTLRRVLAVIEAPGIEAEIHSRCQQCSLCQKLRARPVRTEELAMLPPFGPLESWYIDFAGPYPAPKPQSRHVVASGMREEGEIVEGESRFVCGIIDRWSHYVTLIVVKDVTAETAARCVWETIVQHACIPKFLTSDGGSSFNPKLFKDVMSKLRIDHHISSPIHPEGHSPIERMFRDLNVAFCALIAQGWTDWVRFVGAIAFALNTAWSRAIGTTPFEALHGFPPRAMLEQEAGCDPQRPVDEEDIGDVLHFSASLLRRVEAIRPKIEKILKEIHDRNAAKWREKAKGTTDFCAGSYVMLFTPRRGKLDLEWTGPFQVVRRVPDRNEIYEITELNTDRRQQVHVNRLHVFHVGKLTRTELIAETTKAGEYYIERVREHRVDDGELWFFVDWTGYPPSDPDDPNSGGWVSYTDSHLSPVLKNYTIAHRLETAIRRRNRRLGAPPRS